jgi:Kef-type K+ transport system membrane component KefB
MVGITGYAVDVVANIGNHISHLPVGETIIFDIALILIVSAILAFIAKMLRQPLIPAYVLAGLIIGPLVLGLIRNLDLIYAFSEIGIAFLLFTAGLEISFKKIKEAGLKRIALIGVLQVGIIFGIAYFLSGFLGLTTLQAAYIGIILAFGSTMVDIKLLADRGELVTLHGRLVLGILLLQDLVAIVAIVVFTSGNFATAPLLIAFAKLVGILVFAILLQKYVLNKLFRFAARSNELLFLSSLAVLFLFIILAYVSDLSIVIGAFIAGVSLANSPFKIELESRISPLRDFFAILFFVALGMQIVFTGIGSRMVLFWVLLATAFIIKPLITLVLLRLTGYRPRTSFLTAISLAQLSEFSLIIGAIGVSLGALDMSIFSTVILATIITMSVTPYFIDFKEGIYRFLKYPVALLRWLPMMEDLEYENKKCKEVLLVGSHRMGGALMEELLTKKDKLLIVDYNPEVINVLKKKKISCIYGDITSPELIDKIDVKKLKLVISTIPNYEETLHLVKKVKMLSPKANVVVTGSRISETLKLYAAGADYVVTPKIIAGQELANIIHARNFDLKKAKRKHLRHLGDIHKLLY